MIELDQAMVDRVHERLLAGLAEKLPPDIARERAAILMPMSRHRMRVGSTLKWDKIYDVLKLFLRTTMTEHEAEKFCLSLEEAMDDAFTGESRPFPTQWLDMHEDCISWRHKDRAYWKGLYARIEAETRPMGDNNRSRRFSWPRWLSSARQRLNLHMPVAYVEERPTDSAEEILRRARFVFRMASVSGNTRGDDPVRDYGEKVGQAIRDAMSDEFADLDCVDNYRFAKLSNTGDVKRYNARRDGGCCGTFDKKIEIDGDEYLIGCNHGH